KNLDLSMDDRSQAHVLMIFPVPGISSPDTPSLKVLNKILSGQGGMLFTQLRDRQGLAYSVTSLLWQSPEAGFLAFYIGTYPDRLQEAEQGFRKIALKLRETELDPDEVHRAANMIYGEYHRGRQTISARAGEASSLLVQGLDLDYNLQMTSRVTRVSPDDIRKVAQEYIDPEKSYILKVLPQ
ncbi:MAG: M16 family metallopeptidase, partial [Desulfonatronovibrionaceae bacterium]